MTRSSATVLKYISLPFKVAITAILLIVALFILLPVLWFITYLYRGLVLCVAKCIIPDGRILRKQDQALAAEQYESADSYTTLQITLDGYLSVEDVKKQWMEVIMKKRNKSGKLQFPELQDHIHAFGGFAFRRRIEDFDINNSIEMHPQVNGMHEMVDKLKILDIRKKFHFTVFRKKTPVWKILVVNNYRENNSDEDPECTVFIIKFHHLLADGIAILNLFCGHLAESDSENEKVKKSSEQGNTANSIPILMQIPSMISKLLTNIYKAMFMAMFKNEDMLDINDWHPPQRKLYRDYEWWIPEPINKHVFREVKSALNVSVMSVVVSVIFGGMRRMMLAKNLNLPKTMRVCLPVNVPNHPDGLTNDCLVIRIDSPVAMEDCKERILMNDQLIKYETLITADNPITDFLGGLLFDIIPLCLKRLMNYDTAASSYILSVGMPPGKKLIFFGHPSVTYSTLMSACRSNVGFVVNILGHNDYFYPSFQIDSSLVEGQEDMKQMEKYILEELDWLPKHV